MIINLDEYTFEEGCGITAEDVRRDLNKIMKRVYINNKHMADVLADDYNQYQNVTGKDPDDAIKSIWEKELPGAKELYPYTSDQDIVGYLFSQRLYKAIRKIAR